MTPTPKPPDMPVVSLRKFVDIIPNHFCRDQSMPIMNINTIAIKIPGNDPFKNSPKATICPNEAPKHLAQNGINLPLYAKQRSGIPWHPRYIYWPTDHIWPQRTQCLFSLLEPFAPHNNPSGPARIAPQHAGPARNPSFWIEISIDPHLGHLIRSSLWIFLKTKPQEHRPSPLT